MEVTGYQAEFSTEKFLIKDRNEWLVLRLSMGLEISFVSN